MIYRCLVMIAVVFASVMVSFAQPFPAQPDLTDPEQIDLAMQRAYRLEDAGKFDEARAVYESIIAARPKIVAIVQARLRIAETYKAEGKLTSAIPVLEMIVADQDNVPPGLLNQTRTRLAEIRSEIASNFIKAQKYSEALAELEQVINAPGTPPEPVRVALLKVATLQVEQQKIPEAIKMYRRAIELPRIGDRPRVDDLSSLARIDPSATDLLDEFIRSHPKAAVATLAKAYFEIGRAHLQAGQIDKAVAAFDAVLASKDAPFIFVRWSLQGKADAAIARKDTASAVALYRDLLTKPPAATGGKYVGHDRLADFDRLYAVAPKLDMTAEIAAHLNSIWEIRDVDLTSFSPKNDVLFAVQRGRIKHDSPTFKGTERYRQYLLETTGEAPQDKVNAVNAQIASGGALRPFVTSDFSKAMAKRIKVEAPLADFLRPLLNGEYQSAARVAWKNARLSRAGWERDNWVNAVALAVACEDQVRLGKAGRSAAFLNWAHPDSAAAKDPKAVPADSLASYLGMPELPYQPTETEFTAAAKMVNSLKNVMDLRNGDVIGRVLPDNDVILFALRPFRGVERYEVYLWRTTGRYTEAQIEALRNRIDQGGKDRPFIVSEQAKKLAGMVSEKSPLGEYLQLLLSGDHQGAAKVAWKRAKVITDKKSEDYANWTLAVALATRCYDQIKEGRTVDFLDWTQGKLMDSDGKPVSENPLRAFLGE